MYYEAFVLFCKCSGTRNVLVRPFLVGRTRYFVSEGVECAVKRVTVSAKCLDCEAEVAGRASSSYLPGRGDTMITKVVFPGRGLSIALRMC